MDIFLWIFDSPLDSCPVVISVSRSFGRSTGIVIFFVSSRGF